MKRGILFVLGAIGIMAVACKKDDKSTPTLTRTQLLTSTVWKIDTLTLDINKDGNPDSALPPGTTDDCDVDNTFTFKSDGSGLVDEGATKCEDTLPQSTPFNWSLKNGDSTLVIDGTLLPGLGGDITIQQITDAKLVLVTPISISFPFNINANVIATLKK